jgi:alkanesulfonate monooxygenase SsuD/methylene tetrahydromethanopterin reductase-like flavin-dependent oxidoreductase (luciferase family)
LRPDPVRIAEEYATADVISRGRLEIGFVKSGGSEVASSNVSLIDNGERYWEAIDLISKALTFARRPIQLGRKALHTSPREYLATVLSATATRACGRPPAMRPRPRT